MGNSCVVKPHIQVEEGRYIESNLFNDLLHYSNDDRNFAKKYYKLATDPEFLSKFGGQLTYDQNGEVTFKSLKKLMKFDIEKERLLETLNKDLGAGVYDYDTAMDRLQQFNLNSQYNDDYLATIEQEGNNKYRLSVVEKTRRNEEQLHQTISNRNLWDRIIYQLNKNGVSVEYLQDEGASRYSSENAEQAADGMYSLIKLAKGERQTSTLAEEAGHFAVAALGNHPLVDRLITSLTPEVQKAILGELYDEKQLGNDPRREVAGMLVGKYLNDEIDRKTVISSLLQRIKNLIQKTFARLREDDVKLAKIRAQEAAEEIAKGFMSKNFEGSVEEALAYNNGQGETLYQAETHAETQIFKKAINDVYQLAKSLSRIDSQLSEVMVQKLRNLEYFDIPSKVFNNNNPTGGFTGDASIMGLILLAEDFCDMMVNDIPSKLESINFSNSRNFAQTMRENGQKIRELRMFMKNVGEITQLLKNGLAGSYSEFESIKEREDLRVVDPENGIQRVLPSLKSIQRRLENDVNIFSAKVLEQEREYFLRFLKEIYGDNYVRRSDMRMYKPGTIFSSETIKGFESTNESERGKFSLESYLTALDEDVSLFDAYIGAMSNSSDVISQIVDKAIKIYNREANRKTYEAWDELKVLKKKFEFLKDARDENGQKIKILNDGEDMDTFFERFEDGSLSGNLRTKHKWGVYNRNYREFRKSLERGFHIAHAQELRLVEGKGRKAKQTVITKEQYNQLSEEQKQNVVITKSDLDNVSLIRKDMLWGLYSGDEIKAWERHNSVFDKELGMSVPNKSYDDNTYDAWAERGVDLYVDDEGKYYDAREVKKLKENDPDKYNTLTKEIVTLGSLMDEFMTLKSKLDNAVDNHMPYYRAPQVKAYFGVQVANRVQQDYQDKKFKRARAFGKTLRREVADMFCEDSEDFDYGSAVTYNTIDEDLFRDKMFYEKEKLNRLPLFFINQLRDTAEMSTDIFHSMLAYASMANSYWATAQIVHAAEIGSSLLKERKVAKGNNPKKRETVTGGSQPAEWRKGGLAYRRYLKHLEKQVYGIGLKKLMITKKICLTKIAGMSSKLASMIYLEGNVAGGLVNIGTGFNEMFKEACAGQFYTLNNFANAHKQFWGSSISNWANIGNLAKEDKVSLVIRYFDILGDERANQREWYTKRDRVFGNFLFGESLMLPYSSGERYMQAVTYLSLLDAIELYDMNGNKVKAFDAYKVIDLDDGNKTLQLLNDSSKEMKVGYKVLADLLNFTNEAIRDEGKVTTQQFTDKILHLTEREKNALNAVGIDQSSIGDPREFSNQLTMALDEKQFFFKEADGKAKYNKLMETYEKLESLIAHGSEDADIFSEEEMNMFKEHKVYGLMFKEVMEDGSKILVLNTENPDILDDAKQAISDEIEKLVWGGADEAAFCDKAREVSDRLHGIYNRYDKTWTHQTIIGNMALVMRGYALGMMQRRFGTAKYNIALGTDIEGSYNTLHKMLWASATDKGMFKNTMVQLLFGCFLSKKGQQKMLASLKSYGFNETQFYNMRRNNADLLIIGLLTILKMLTAKKDGGDDDDDDEVDPIVGTAYYLASRLYREQVAFSFPRAFIEEASQYFKPTVPGIAVTLDICEMAEGIYGTTLFDYYDGMTTNDPGGKYFYLQKKKGMYERGDIKWQKKLAKMAPYYKSYLLYKNPYEAASAYDYGRRTVTR